MAKKKYNRDVPLPSSEPLFGKKLGVKKAKINTGVIDGNMGYPVSSLADKSGRALANWGGNSRKEVSNRGYYEEIGADGKMYQESRMTTANKAVQKINKKFQKEGRRKQIQKALKKK